MLTSIDKKINRILLKNNVLSEEKSAEMMGLSTKEKKSFVDVIIDKKIVSEDVLLAYLALEVNLPPIIPEKITVDEKIAEIIPEQKALEYNILPISKIGNILTLVVTDPFDVIRLDDIRILSRCELRLSVTLERQIKKSITHLYHPEEKKMDQLMEDMTGETLELELTQSGAEKDEKLDLTQISDEAGESPVIKFVNMMLAKAMEGGASDIHIEPYEKRVSIRFRYDGILQEAFSPPKRLHNSVVSRIKIIAHLDISERRLPQDGKFQIKKGNKRVDIRVAVIPTVHGERVVLRVLDSSTLDLKLSDLGFEEKDFKAFKRAIDASYGMVLLSGPTGCGKTTTLYCSVKEIFSPDDNIITVEDPVEYQLPGIIQVPVNVKTGMTFAAALKSILRQDPDIIMIGEMRDLETADIGVKAAITGHLVFSTLHTNDSVSTVSRLADMGIDPFMIASAVLLVANQRLLRKLCPNCKRPVKIPADQLITLGFTPEEINKANLFEPVGCPRCTGGYKGRAAIYEVLELDDEIKRLIINGASPLEIKDYAINKLGLTTIRRSAVLKALRGETSVAEVKKNT
ncbi:MAG: ATPase, T2SS/T4P/T4SS family [Planctomycetota bacterium]